MTEADKKAQELYDAFRDASAEYENTYAARIHEARAMIREELKPLTDAREAAWKAYKAAL